MHVDARTAHFYAGYRARRDMRRAAWRASRGNPAAFRAHVRAQLAAQRSAGGFLFYYADEAARPAPRSIGRQLLADVARVTWVCTVIAVGVWASDFLVR